MSFCSIQANQGKSCFGMRFPETGVFPVTSWTLSGSASRLALKPGETPPGFASLLTPSTHSKNMVGRKQPARRKWGLNPPKRARCKQPASAFWDKSHRDSPWAKGSVGCSGCSSPWGKGSASAGPEQLGTAARAQPKEAKSSPKSSNYNLITSNSGFPEPTEGTMGSAP